MALISFLRRNCLPQEESEISFTYNGVGPITFNKLIVSSPTGCSYFILRVYKNGILLLTVPIPSVFKAQNIVDEFFNFGLEKSGTLRVTAANLDPLGQNHSFEGSIT
jgi:hypothetical protein